MFKIKPNLVHILMAIFLFIIALLPIHALISTWAISNFGHEILFKAWKEILLFCVALPMALWIVLTDTLAPKAENKSINRFIFFDRLKNIFSQSSVARLQSRAYFGRAYNHVRHNMLNYTILLFVIVSIVLAVAKNNPTKVEIAGLVFDLRFFAMFIVGQVLALKIASAYFGELVLRFIFWGGVIVVCFGALQVLVLPHDFLRHFGYQNSIIPPYFTVDNNQNMIRILSTLRGPNVLGAYLVFWLPILAVITQRIWFRGRRLYLLPLSALWLASVITILGSRSRSGLLGAVVSIGLFILLGVNNIWRKRLIIIGVIGLLVTALALLLSWNTAFIQTSLKHRDPTERGSINSDDQRTNSLIDSVKAIINNPVGSGPGSVNLASTYGDKPVIVENYYLQVAQQYGFLGLILFMMILVMVCLRLWKIRAYDISAALLAGFVGLAVVNMLLPAWGDETVSMLWWGFAGVVIFGYNKKRKHRKTNEPRASK